MARAAAVSIAAIRAAACGERSTCRCAAPARRDVVHEAAGAAQEAQVLHPPYRRADADGLPIDGVHAAFPLTS